MKRSVFLNVVLAAMVLAVGATGCKHKTVGVIPLEPGKTKGPVTAEIDKQPVVPDTGTKVNTETPTVDGKPVKDPNELSNLDLINGMVPNPIIFKANTVYFDYDRAVVKPSERRKIEEVAAYLKGATDNKLMVDGHCDERGTEEYNRALGERRALALREYFIKLGIAGDRVYTRTYGEDRPAVEGHDEAAWAKNRRGEFILLTPKPSTN